MDWFATYSAGILRGSLCKTDDATQLIWIKLMAMSNEAKDPNSGRLEYAKGDPYDIPYVATICHKTVEEVEKALDAFQKDISKDGTPRVTVESDGTIVLNNFPKMQMKNRTNPKQ